MFRNRKKSSAKRPEEPRDRDNSRVLDRYSDTDIAAAPLPLRSENTPPRNFQYLKLTDGFNIVLSSDTGNSQSPSSPRPSSPHSSSSPSSQLSPSQSQLPVEKNCNSGDKFKVGSDKTTANVLHNKETDTQQVKSHLQNPKENISTNPPSQSPPSDSRDGSLVSPAKPETTGLFAESKEDSTPAKPSAHPPPAVGHTVSSLARKEDTWAMFDVEPVTPTNRTTHVVSPNGKASDIHSENAGEWTRKNISTEARGRGKGEESLGTEESSDKQENPCLESGRGPSANTSPSRHTVCPPPGRIETRADTDRAKSLSCLNTNLAARVSEFVPSTSTWPKDDKEPNRPSEQNSTVTSTSTGGGSERQPHGVTQAFPHVKQKADSEETTVSQPQTGQDHSGTEDPAHPERDRDQAVRTWHGDSQPGASAINLSTSAGRGSDQYTDTSQSGEDNVSVNVTKQNCSNIILIKTEKKQDILNVNLAGTEQRPESANVSLIRSEEKRESAIRIGKTKDSANITGNVTESGRRRNPADMFRSTRHHLNTNLDPDDQPVAVYRKLEDKTIVTPTEAADAQTTPQLPDVIDVTSDPGLHQTQTECFLLPTPPRSGPPTPLPKPRKRGGGRVYENWTINQAVTQPTNIDDDDDDDDDDVDSDNISPFSTLDRHSTSKDSELCVDAQTTAVVAETGADGVDAAAVVVSVEGDGGGGGDGGEGMIQAGGETDTLRCEDGSADVQDSAVPEAGIDLYQNTEVLRMSQRTAHSHDDVPDSPADSPRVVNKQIRDLGSHPDTHSLASTASEDDDHHHHKHDSDSSFEDGEVAAVRRMKTVGAPCARDNMLKMRHLLVTGVLETERTYLAILELLLHYKRTLEASCRTSQPVISEEDIDLIFSNLHELLDIHKGFVDGLQSKVDAWSPEQTVGDIFMHLVEKFGEFGGYAENYQTAVATIHKCAQDNHRFQDLAQQIVLTSTTREVTSLEDALFKPVQRLQRNTLVLYDLIKHTPEDHPDQETLQNALQLSQRNLENFGTSLMPRNKVEQKGHLVKSSFLVELVGGSRKLRYIFVFSESLVCTKREQENRGGEVTFDCKWFIPMNMLKLDTKFTYQDDMKFSKKDEIQDVKKKLRSVKNEIKKELKKEENKDKPRPVSNLVPSRIVEKLQRKANELEGQLILASPRLPFKVWHDTGKAHTLLMTTDYEREEWRELLSSLQRQSTELDAASPSAIDMQEMVNSVSGLPEINEIGSVLMDTEEEVMYGTLNVTVHKLTGLTQPCDTYCCLEMDSYGHFFMKAKTHISSSTTEPSWNADFELELEGSQTLRVLCYKKGPDKQGDVLLGRGALEMTKEWLKGNGVFQEKTVTMNEYSLVLSVCYMETEKTMRRTPARQSGTAVFGVQIHACATREGKTVPTIVTACVQEVEKRGMEETGIYRVSGVTSDVQRLKKQFDKNVKAGVASISDVDIHSVTSLLKLYLRELPDPVFTEASYPNFLDALKLNDKEGKEKCMLSLFYNLPDINYYTAVYMLEHLLRISKHEASNKMSIHNLSTIFGPTLLAPATKKMAVSVIEMMTLGAEHCMKQSEVIYFYLNLLVKGGSLRRSSAAQT